MAGRSHEPSWNTRPQSASRAWPSTATGSPKGQGNHRGKPALATLHNGIHAKHRIRPEGRDFARRPQASPQRTGRPEEGNGRVSHRDCRAEATSTSTRTGTSPPEHCQRESDAGRCSRRAFAGAALQCEGPGIATAAARTVGRRLRSPGGRFRPVHLQLGGRQGPPADQALAGPRRPQDFGQEGRGGTIGIAAGSTLAGPAGSAASDRQPSGSSAAWSDRPWP